jgi:ATP-dependent RNA helicase SUPV3L1/SUV3
VSLQDKALGSLANTQPGDCIVCFNKNDIYNVSRNLEFIKKNKFLFRIKL